MIIERAIRDFVKFYFPEGELRVNETFDKKAIQLIHNIGSRFFIRKNIKLTRPEIENQICVFMLKCLEDEMIVLDELKKKIEDIIDDLRANDINEILINND